MAFGKKGKKKVKVENDVVVNRTGPSTLECEEISYKTCKKHTTGFTVKGSTHGGKFLVEVDERYSGPSISMYRFGISIRDKKEAYELIDALAEVAEVLG